MKRNRNTKNLLLSIILLLVLTIGIGYAYLTSNLSITGATEVVANSWNIHFENLNVKNGSVTAINPATIESSQTDITYSIHLARPKDYYEFTVDVKNDGTLPGKISISELSGLPPEAETIIDYSITYISGSPLNQDDILNPESKKTIKIRVFYKDDINPEDFPDTDLNLTLTYSLRFVQSEVFEINSSNLLQNLRSTNSCISKYNGQVTDEVNNTVTASNVLIDRCADKRNIIFGGFCWQMIRTTETGGMKMIYNGEPIDNKCESTRSDHRGIVQVNNADQAINTSYLYSSSFEYNEDNNIMTLTNPEIATWSNETYEDLIGKYTCKNTTGTCTTIYRINDYISPTNALLTTYSLNNTNYAQIGTSPFNTDSTTLSKAGYMYNVIYDKKTNYPIREDIGNNIFYYGDSYTDNGDGTYTIDNPTSISIEDWSTNHSNTIDKYICKNSINNKCDDIWYVIGTTVNTAYNYFNCFKLSNPLKFGSDFTYSNGVYTLSGDTKEYWILGDEEHNTSLKTRHYTCWNTSGTCTNISYIFRYNTLNKYNFYITISGGKNINDAITEMLYSDDVNRYNSNIKGIIDVWYENNLIDYTGYIEDAIYCNDRKIKNKNGWDPNSESVTTALSFNNSNSLACNYITDRFSTSNAKAKLTYPIGLIESPEVNAIYNNSLMQTGYTYRALTPSSYTNEQILSLTLRDNGSPAPGNNYAVNGIRPVISLSEYATIISGTGTETDPWIVK